MLQSLPKTTEDFINWEWEQIKPYYDELNERPLHKDSVVQWLLDWTHLRELISECLNRLRLATRRDTNDVEAQERFKTYLKDIFPEIQAGNNRLTQRFLESELEVEGMEVPRRSMEADAVLFCEANLPLFTEEQKHVMDYERITGSQTVEWNGEETTLAKLSNIFQNDDRDERERAWRLMLDRHLQDREALNQNWVELLTIRHDIAQNLELENYQDFAWIEKRRFDYLPQDCYEFHNAIEQTVVPAAARLYERRRKSLDVETLRPWDVVVDPNGHSPLKPYDTVDELESTTARIFRNIDPILGDYFDTMRERSLLDLENRKGKRVGAFCTHFDATGEPFVVMNAVGSHSDVITLLHESGHAFHVFETAHLPYYQQNDIGMEFVEVPSQAMELLVVPYLHEDRGGYYNDQDHARATLQLLDRIITFLPYMAVVDAFQHWVYENTESALDPNNCDTTWRALWDRFMVGIDWSGFEAEKSTGWHRKRHIFARPFYYVEYGMAYLGAVQIWKNALEDQEKALKAYRRALALGGTVPLPDLYAAADIKFAFDVDTLRSCVDLIESQIEILEAKL